LVFQHFQFIGEFFIPPTILVMLRQKRQ